MRLHFQAMYLLALIVFMNIVSESSALQATKHDPVLVGRDQADHKQPFLPCKGRLILMLTNSIGDGTNNDTQFMVVY